MIPFNRPNVTGGELVYIAEAIARLQLSANGEFTARCQRLLAAHFDCPQVLLTHSCTAALELAALLANIGPGDEVIMPSFTFVSTANAFVLRGATPVFVDIRPDTLNLDESLIQKAITPRTKAIVPVHYAGVAAEMSAILTIAASHNLTVIEDAAQAMFAGYLGRPLGTFGSLAAVSFHETKNVICGEGGALIVNDPTLCERAEVLHEKGTGRAAFRRGETSRYTWLDIGSSFAPSEITAAFLYAQLQHGESITAHRLSQWNRYHAAFASLESQGAVERPIIPAGCRHNAHLYRLLLRTPSARAEAIEALASLGIQAIFHYVPLHNSPAGLRYGRVSGRLPVTEDAAARLLRLPLHARLTEAEQEHIVRAVHSVCLQQAETAA